MYFLHNHNVKLDSFYISDLTVDTMMFLYEWEFKDLSEKLTVIIFQLIQKSNAMKMFGS